MLGSWLTNTRHPSVSVTRVREPWAADMSSPDFLGFSPFPLKLCNSRLKRSCLAERRLSLKLKSLCVAMRSLALLSASLVAAVQGSNLLYPKGCSDATKANYWPDNKDSSAECFSTATVYCPDPLADNYNSASRKPRPRIRRAS